MISRISKHIVPSLLALLLILSLPLTAFAAQPNFDIAQKGSIQVTLKTAGTAASVGGKLELYKVGDAVVTNNNLTFVPTDAFAASNISLSDLQASGLAGSLADYARQQNITGTVVSATASAAAVFPNLSTGLYLLVQTEAADGYLPVSPFLVSLPMYSAEEGGWNYQIEATPKVQPVPKEPVQLTVVKKWKDNSSTNRPTKVKVNLLKDGEVSESVTLNKSNSWTHTWKGLDPNCEWTVKEVVPSGYKASYSTKGHTTTITNTSKTYKAPDKLVQTGQLNWPVPILVCSGLALIVTGILLQRWRKQDP